VAAETLWRMDSLDIRELHLAVGRNNPARTLYRRLGFTEKSHRELRDLGTQPRARQLS
jgi:hypothetical protein